MNRLTKRLLCAALCALALSTMKAQTENTSPTKAHRVLFEVTMEGSEQWTGVLNNVENVRKSLGEATEIEVVAHSKGLGMLLAKDNKLTDRMQKLSEAGVVFAACENTMKKKRDEGPARPFCDHDRFRRGGSGAQKGSGLELHQERHMKRRSPIATDLPRSVFGQDGVLSPATKNGAGKP